MGVKLKKFFRAAEIKEVNRPLKVTLSYHIALDRVTNTKTNKTTQHNAPAN
jgi:hypothetical protein